MRIGWSAAAAAALLLAAAAFLLLRGEDGPPPGGPGAAPPAPAAAPGAPPPPATGTPGGAGGRPGPRTSAPPLPSDREGLLRLLAEEKDPARRILVIAALQNLGDPAAAPDLVALWRSETDWRVRVALLEAAAELGGPEVDALLAGILRSPEGDGRDWILFGEIAAAALAGRNTEEARGELGRLLREPGDGPRDDAALTRRSLILDALGMEGGPGSLALLASVSGDPSLPAEFRGRALRAVGAVDGPEAGRLLRESLARALETGDPAAAGEEDLRADAVMAIGMRGADPEGAAALAPLASGERAVPEEIRRLALGGLARTGGAESAAVLLAAARDPSVHAATRRSAWTAYGRVLGEAALPAMEEAVAAPGLAKGDRVDVVKAVARVGGKAAREVLERLAKSGDPDVARAASGFLR